MEKKTKTNSGFIPPSKARRDNALGNPATSSTAVAKAVSNVDKYWEPLRMPHSGDWLDSFNHGCVNYDEFKGKKITATKNVLYI